MTTTLRSNFLAVLAVFSFAASASAQSNSRTSGANISLTPSDPMFVQYLPQDEGYILQVDLIFDPFAPPMEKHFQSPTFHLDAFQPAPQPVWEDFFIVSGPPVIALLALGGLATLIRRRTHTRSV